MNGDIKTIYNVHEELAQWRTALAAAFALAGFKAVYHELKTSGCRIGEFHVTRDSDDIRYKVEFQSGIKTTGSWAQNNVKRTAVCLVEVLNPVGGIHVKFKGYSPEKVEKIVAYAGLFITQKQARETAVEAKRKRATVARAVWTDSGVTIPDWMHTSANTERDEDVGTFSVYFSEHSKTYGMKRLTPGQIGRIAAYIQSVIAEPPVDVAEKELVEKILKHEGRPTNI